ncbi:MAG: hypothetical protein QOJ86_3299 [Bradyrhizobium sp.]|nr:hypothetical protein [Bradyrhizobium sp.]
MSVLPLFFGFLFGAAIGTVATASKGKELHEQAGTFFREIPNWLEERRRGRTEKRKNRRTELRRRYIALANVAKLIEQNAIGKAVSRWRRALATLKSRWPLTYLKWRWPLASPEWYWPADALEMTKVQVLAVFVGLWIIGLIWAVLLPALEDKPHVQYILGTLVGGAAAPWIWLHFSHDLELSGTSDQGRFGRYRFMTYALGAVLLVAFLEPYLGKLLPRANKIEGFGVAVNFERSRTDHASNVLQVGQATTSVAATTGRLSVATRKAHLVATGRREGKLTGEVRTLKEVNETMEGFGDLSLIDRDQVYIAYFYHERNSTGFQSFQNLEEYVKATKIDLDSFDAEFLGSLAELTHCIALYAERLRDFRLFLVNSEPFLRSLLVNISTNWTIRDDAAETPAKPPLAKLPLNAGNLAKQIVEALNANNSGSTGVCSDELRLSSLRPPTATKTVAPGKPAVPNVSEIGKKTPYPAYQIAHYMAAIDSVESGVLILRDWLLHQRKQLARDLDKTPEQEWYAIRAMLASSQLPGLSNAPRHKSLVQFQQETTDRMGMMLGISDAATWRALCRKLRRQGLHAHVGRYLAMTYADERNFLFELLLPEDLGVPPPGEAALKSTLISPRTYVQEAEAIVEKPDCFAGVPRFDRRLLGQYSLNLAQLRMAARATVPENERPALTSAIRADLEAAKQLGDSEEGETLDLLREPNEFTPQRERLARLKLKLDNEGGKD